MADQEQPNQPAENQDESAPQQPAKKGFDTKFFLMVLVFSLVFMLISQTPLLGLGLFWFNKTGLTPRYSGSLVDCVSAKAFENKPIEWKNWTAEAANKYLNGDQAILIALIQQEAGWNPDARSNYSTATGLGQFLDGTAKGLTDNNGNKFFEVVTPDGVGLNDSRRNPQFAIPATAYYFSKGIDLAKKKGHSIPVMETYKWAYFLKYHGGGNYSPGSRPYTEGIKGAMNILKNYASMLTDGSCRQQVSGGDANYIPGSGGWSWALANGKEDTACRAVHSCFMLKGIPYCASDLGASEGLSSGSPVLAIGDGTITFQKTSRHYGSDPYLYVRKNGHIAGYNAKFVSSDGKVEAFYAHIYRPKVAVQPIFTVKGGQQFATIYPWNKPDPDHENVYNSHLHFELRVNGYAITCSNQLDKIKEFQGGN